MGRDSGEARRWGARVALVAGVVVLAAVMLVGWNKVAASPELCATCHTMDDSVTSAARSVHALSALTPPQPATPTSKSIPSLRMRES